MWHIKIVFFVPEGLLLVVWSSIGLWVGLVCGSIVFTLLCDGLGWIGSVVWWVELGWRNWTHGQLWNVTRGQSRDVGRKWFPEGRGGAEKRTRKYVQSPSWHQKYMRGWVGSLAKHKTVTQTFCPPLLHFYRGGGEIVRRWPRISTSVSK